MTDTRTRPPCEAVARGLNQGLAALRFAGRLAAKLSEQATLDTSLTFGVDSVAEVDRIAEGLDIEPAWTPSGTYEATWTEETVTVTVRFTAPPLVAPADAAGIEAAGRAT
jgi:hypothetical protein